MIVMNKSLLTLWGGLDILGRVGLSPLYTSLGRVSVSSLIQCTIRLKQVSNSMELVRDRIELASVRLQPRSGRLEQCLVLPLWLLKTSTSE